MPELAATLKAIYESECVIFFGSVRWGSMNAIYQKLLERLTWIENRQSTLRDINPVKGIKAGLIALGHNWRGLDVLKQQQTILNVFGFDTPDVIYFNHQWTKEAHDESEKGYIQDSKDFDVSILDLTNRIIQ